jgi:hypothetical protein
MEVEIPREFFDRSRDGTTAVVADDSHIFSLHRKWVYRPGKVEGADMC